MSAYLQTFLLRCTIGKTEIVQRSDCALYILKTT